MRNGTPPDASSSSARVPGDMSPEQRAVVEFPARGGHLLVTAPPGSGKTRTIVLRIAHLLNSEAAKPGDILALTFTERSANELANRLESVSHLGVTASTFHGFCLSLLRDQGLGAGQRRPVFVWTSSVQEEVVRQAAEHTGLPRLDGPAIRRIKSAISRWKREHLNYEDLVGETRFNATITEMLFYEYERIRRSQQAFDFDDLIIEASSLLWNDEDVSSRMHDRFRFVFVDEYQDVSSDQFRLLMAIAPPQVAGRQVMAVADENQAIFRFRGAEPVEMLRQFRLHYRPTRLSLGENHRSVARIVSAANAVAHGVDSTPPISSSRQSGMDVHCFEFPDEVAEARGIARLIKNARASEHDYGDIAVLYRRHQRADLVEDELIRSDIPIARIRPDRFLDRPDAQEIIRYLELARSMQDVGMIRSLNWPRFLVDELSMLELQRVADDAGISLAALARDAPMLRKSLSPLTATIVSRFTADVAEIVEDPSNTNPVSVIGSLLELLSRRRNPIPVDRRDEMRAIQDQLTKRVETESRQLDEALEQGRAIAVQHDGHPDSDLASRVFARVMKDYFDVDVLRGVEAEGEGFLVFFGNREGSVGSGIALAFGKEGRWTITALTYRLCQRLLMLRETLTRGNFVVFDLETTSERPRSAEIVEVGAVRVEEGAIVGDVFHRKVRPSGPESLSDEAVDVHGLRWEDLRDAPEPGDVLPELLDVIGNDVVAGHNIRAFDIPVFERASDRLGIPNKPFRIVDTLQLARRLRPGRPNALHDLISEEERAGRTVHGALGDARLTAKVLVRLLEDLERDREVDVLVEEAPLVAASTWLRACEENPDIRSVREIGGRTYALWFERGDAAQIEDLRRVGTPLDLEQLLGRSNAGRQRDDETWDELSEGWRDIADRYAAFSPNQDLHSFLAFVSLATSSDLESDADDRVAMMTVYSAKGHEWPIVILAGVEDDQFPYSYSRDDEDIEEGRRALYVGMTRAEDRLFLTSVLRFGGLPRRRSRFLESVGKSIRFQRVSG